ncbi:hypothetical protein GOP47_0016752 [Adiantum capillus-veneris]|uniref:AB hydrolase-1 domain-containing protein n=1 Tax=Adiantum capillus-veneris TaxID=13818 RepID=A0A9D4ZC04_ADICA|nr:hypothetical protein GOP47_0016752 [Adiantum capillus-veneris]
MASSAPCFGFSLAHLRDRQLDYFFRSCGLQHLCFQVDPATTMACWCKPSAAETLADQNKPAIVLIHGFATSALWQWCEQVKPLQRNFRVFVPDLIFFGKSTTKGSSRSETFQAEMIAKAMETMNVPSYSVVGTSYGGFVAFRLAHLFPQRVQKVVIANSGVCTTCQDEQELLERAKLKVVEDLLLPQSVAAFRTLLCLSYNSFLRNIPSFVLQSLLQYFYVENRDLQVELLQGLTLGKENAEPLPTLLQKVLLIWGEHDGIFPPKMAHRLKKHLGDNAELVFIKNVAHCAQAENPKEFNKLVEKFLLTLPS